MVLNGLISAERSHKLVRIRINIWKISFSFQIRPKSTCSWRYIFIMILDSIRSELRNLVSDRFPIRINLAYPYMMVLWLIAYDPPRALLDSKYHLKWKLPETRCSIQNGVQKCSSSIYLQLNRSPDKGCFSELSTYRLARIDCSFCGQRWPCDVKVTCEMYLLRFLMVIWWLLKRAFTLHLHNWLNSLSSFLVPWRYDHLHSR